MDLSDNFISYDDEFYIKQEKISDHDLSLGSPFSGDTDSTALYPISIPTNLHNLLNNSEPIHDTYNWNNEHTVKKYQPFHIIKTKKEVVDDNIQVKVEPEDKILNRTKRILKREKAKQRTKTKSDTSNFLSQISSKYIPEGFHDPTLDDKTKKKMIQMIRNRISAQNSRDRKKAYVNHLESLKHKLFEDSQKIANDKFSLLQEYKKLEEAHAKLLLENQELKKNRNYVCSHCGRNDEALNGSEEGTSETFSLSSPSNLTRNSNLNKSFFTYAFAFATILSCVLVMNITNSQMSLPGTSDSRPSRILSENTPQITEKKAPQPCIRDEESMDPEGPIILKNIKPLKKEFHEHYLTLYQSDMEKTTSVKVEEKEMETAIVDYRTFNREFLSKEIDVSKNLPVLDFRPEVRTNTTTLFCPNGLELVDEEEHKQVGMDDENNKARSSNIGKSQYLQLFVPRSSLGQYNLGEINPRTSAPTSNENGDDSSILELWCKVFFVRELSSNF